jgi:hypothetical protein
VDTMKKLCHKIEIMQLLYVTFFLNEDFVELCFNGAQLVDSRNMSEVRRCGSLPARA